MCIWAVCCKILISPQYHTCKYKKISNYLIIIISITYINNNNTNEPNNNKYTFNNCINFSVSSLSLITYSTLLICLHKLRVFVPATHMQLRVFVPATHMQLRVFVPAAHIQLRVFVPATHKQLRVFVPATHMQLRVFVPEWQGGGCLA